MSVKSMAFLSGVVFLDGWDIPVVFLDVANGIGSGACAGFGSDDRQAAQDRFGADLNLIHAGNRAAGRIDQKLYAVVLH